MTAVRQDAWSEEDDLILAEVTLRQIREGGTQLAAFEEVGERIGRTAAACGFRWNSFVRKKIRGSDRHRQSPAPKEKPGQTPFCRGYGKQPLRLVRSRSDGHRRSFSRTEAYTEEAISIDAVIRFLKQWKTTYQEMARQIKSAEKDLNEKEEELFFS